MWIRFKRLVRYNTVRTIYNVSKGRKYFHTFQLVLKKGNILEEFHNSLSEIEYHSTDMVRIMFMNNMKYNVTWHRAMSVLNIMTKRNCHPHRSAKWGHFVPSGRTF